MLTKEEDKDVAIVYKQSSQASEGGNGNVTNYTGVPAITRTSSVPAAAGADSNHNNSIKHDNEFEGNDSSNHRTCGICPNLVSGRIITIGNPKDNSNDENNSNIFPCHCSVDYKFNPCTMILSTLIIWLFVIWCIFDENIETQLSLMQSWIIYHCTWFYIGSLILFWCFLLYILFHKEYSNIKLGPIDEPPKYGLGTWFAMLFTAGIAIGLYFWSVAEPVWHYSDSKYIGNRYYTDGDNIERAIDALNLAWFHWGIGPGSVIYCTVGLPIAYFIHVKNKPLKFSTPFMPLIGEKYGNGFIANVIDTLAVVETMCGVATSLGFGAMQLNAMLNFIAPDTFNAEDETIRIILIWIVTTFATITVLLGLDRGIRRLAQSTVIFSFILLIYLFLICDPYYLLNLFVQTFGYHIQYLIELSFITDAFQQAAFVESEDGSLNTYYETWMSYWTIFYWGWWIAWAPFVGTFIAQISRGRTIREFILGAVAGPALLLSIWFTVFGGVALYNELAFDQLDSNYGSKVTCPAYDTYGNATYTAYSEYNGQNVVYLECFATQTMLFEMINAYPLGNVMNILAGIGLVTYFVTSSDSASHILDILTADGDKEEEPPKIQKIFWAVSEGAVACVLLMLGGTSGLTAVQTINVVTGLPFCAIMILLCYAFWYMLRLDSMKKKYKMIQKRKEDKSKGNGKVNNDDNDNDKVGVNVNGINLQHRISIDRRNSNHENMDNYSKHKNRDNNGDNPNGKDKEICVRDGVWRAHLLDSTNILENDFDILYDWFLSLLCPCWVQWQNYNKMCDNDVNGKLFRGSESTYSKIFWFLWIFGTSLLCVTCAIIGIALRITDPSRHDNNKQDTADGCFMLAVVFYIFFICVNAWQRYRIREYYNINEPSYNICCDLILHMICLYPWTITQEKVQITKYDLNENDVELVANQVSNNNMKNNSNNI